MADKPNTFDVERCAGELPESALERNLIQDYLRERGYSLADLQKLPAEETRRLMKEACQYAALKLAEVESRAKFQREIHPPM